MARACSSARRTTLCCGSAKAPDEPAIDYDGELLEAARGLRILAFEDGWLDAPGRFVQRIVAMREAGGPEAALPARFPLEAPR